MDALNLEVNTCRIWNVASISTSHHNSAWGRRCRPWSTTPAYGKVPVQRRVCGRTYFFQIKFSTLHDFVYIISELGYRGKYRFMTRHVVAAIVSFSCLMISTKGCLICIMYSRKIRSDTKIVRIPCAFVSF